MLSPDLVVRPRIDWREEEGLVVLLAPRFGRSAAGRLLGRLLCNPTFRVRLDALGSHIWSLCDGSTTLEEMAASLEQDFGDQADQARERVEEFLVKLHRSGWIVLLRSLTAPPPAGSPSGEP